MSRFTSQSYWSKRFRRHWSLARNTVDAWMPKIHCLPNQSIVVCIHFNVQSVIKHLHMSAIYIVMWSIIRVNVHSSVKIVENVLRETVICVYMSAHTVVNDHIRVTYAIENSHIHQIWIHIFAFTLTASHSIVHCAIKISINCDIWSDTWKFMIEIHRTTILHEPHFFGVFFFFFIFNLHWLVERFVRIDDKGIY